MLGCKNQRKTTDLVRLKTQDSVHNLLTPSDPHSQVGLSRLNTATVQTAPKAHSSGDSQLIFPSPT
ncbi:hypothetical protein J6590_067580 [Homalodisca vitripennis]|nr:hypothetical protein J6590_067580 [Homalodisca vitripennis]